MLFKNNYGLIALFVGASAVRVLFFFLFLEPNPVRLAYDSGHYHAVAQRLAEGYGFTHTNGSSNFYRLPGYPCFLAGCYVMFGQSPCAALMVQLVLASCIPILVFLLACLLFRGRLIAWLSALIAALHPGFLIMSGLLMSETLFVFLFLLFMIFLVRRFTLCAGLLLGCASLVRPVGVPMLVVGMLWIVIMDYRSGARTRVRDLSCFIFSYLLIVLPWLIRNFFLTGGLFLHTLSAPHVLNHGAARVIMQAHCVAYTAAQKYVHKAVQDELKQWRHCSQEYAHLMVGERVATRIFFAHPLITIKLCCVNMFKTLCGLYSSELLVVDSGGSLPTYDDGVVVRIKRLLMPKLNNHHILYVIYAELLFNIIIMLGVVGSCWHVVRKRRYYVQSSMLISFSVVFVILSCICGFARLRLPSEPFFIMLAVQRFYLLHRRKEHE